MLLIRNQYYSGIHSATYRFGLIGERMTFDLRKLKYFVATAEELHFGRAARRLGLSQPPLSMQLRALELDLGARLFDRDNRNVALTKVGAILLQEARKILAQ